MASSTSSLQGFGQGDGAAQAEDGVALLNRVEPQRGQETRALGHAGGRQDSAQGHAGPAPVADGVAAPEHGAIRVGIGQHLPTAVAGALQGGRQFGLREIARQVSEAQRERPIHQTINFEAPGVRGDLGHGGVIAGEEEFSVGVSKAARSSASGGPALKGSPR